MAAISIMQNWASWASADRPVLAIVLYLLGWILMTAAMMLPTTLPLLEIFRRLIMRRPDRWQLMIEVITGYLSVWLVFGIAAHSADWLLHQAVERSPWLDTNGWVIGAGTLLLAGGFQFTGLKYRCLDKCRAPLSFVMEHWRGRHEHRNALLLGIHHGVFCVGCCWALMLLMFAVGIGNVGWMLALGALMAMEKNMPWGRKLSAPVGVALLACWSLDRVEPFLFHPRLARFVTRKGTPQSISLSNEGTQSGKGPHEQIRSTNRLLKKTHMLRCAQIASLQRTVSTP